MKALRRELGRAVYGLMWLAVAAIALVLWPAIQFGDLFDGDRLAYLYWVCWSLMGLGFLTALLDDRVRAAIDAHNNEVFDGQPFLWPAKKPRSSGPGWFGPGRAGLIAGVLRLILVVELVFQMFDEPAPMLAYMPVPALFMSVFLMLRAMAGPVFAGRKP